MNFNWFLSQKKKCIPPFFAQNGRFIIHQTMKNVKREEFRKLYCAVKRDFSVNRRHCRLRSGTYVEWLKSADSQASPVLYSCCKQKFQFQTAFSVYEWNYTKSSFNDSIYNNHTRFFLFLPNHDISILQLIKKQQNISMCLAIEIEIFPIEIPARDYLWSKSDFSKIKGLKSDFKWINFPRETQFRLLFYAFIGGENVSSHVMALQI